jgi:SAM-dependent methyltransferase
MAPELKNWLVHRIHNRILMPMIERYCRGRVLDMGCGTKPYRQMLSPYISTHIGIDHPLTPHGIGAVDIYATAWALPLANASIDCVLSTAVLEHLEEPAKAIEESFRVLKPGGTAIFSAPFIWHLHEEPRDFFRFSRFGLAYLFEKAGFKVLQTEALSGFWFTFGQMLVHYIYRFNRGPFRWLGIIPALGVVFQLFFYGLDRLDKAEQWTWMYTIAASKPEDGSKP